MNFVLQRGGKSREKKASAHGAAHNMGMSGAGEAGQRVSFEARQTNTGFQAALLIAHVSFGFWEEIEKPKLAELRVAHLPQLSHKARWW